MRKSAFIVLLVSAAVASESTSVRRSAIGREVSVPRHLADDEEFRLPLDELLRHGKLLFGANWTEQEGGGRPLSKGTGRSLTDPSQPLTGRRAFNRVSAPDANSCGGCHNQPYGIVGGGGDFVTNVFVLGQRFDFATLDPADRIPTRGAADERGQTVTLQTIGNSRATPGLFGAGFIEMLAREMTQELQAIRDRIPLGGSAALVAKGISFGTLARKADGMWDASRVVGLPRLSVVSFTPLDPPSLVVRPWHQSGNLVSIRDFTVTAMNHHHGIQATERFGLDADPDGDGFENELSRADVTALSLFQAALPVPGRVIPNDPEVERAVLDGERAFAAIGCARCHVPALPLTKAGWTYSEPNPYNAPLTLRTGTAPPVSMDLTSASLPQPRLRPAADSPDVIWVPAFTDLKLHDISDPAEPMEAVDQNQHVFTGKFLEGNRRFLTKRLWGAANEPPYFHHGLFATMRQAVLAHHGEALEERRAFQSLPPERQDNLIEFLKTLQVLPPGATSLVVDENGQPRAWPPVR